MKISYLVNTSDDLKVISRWYFDEWGHLNPSNTEEKIYERLSSKFDKEDEFLCFVVIHEKELLVAVADLKYREHKDYPEYEHWIGGVYVKPECRGKGYASALIEKAKEHVFNLSISELVPLRRGRFVEAQVALEAFADAPVIDLKALRDDLDLIADPDFLPRG